MEERRPGGRKDASTNLVWGNIEDLKNPASQSWSDILYAHVPDTCLACGNVNFGRKSSGGSINCKKGLPKSYVRARQRTATSDTSLSDICYGFIYWKQQ